MTMKLTGTDRRTGRRTDGQDHVLSQADPLTKNVKSVIGWNKSGPPSQLFQNGQFENSPTGLAAIMNNFFIDKVDQHLLTMLRF